VRVEMLRLGGGDVVGESRWSNIGRSRCCLWDREEHMLEHDVVLGDGCP